MRIKGNTTVVVEDEQHYRFVAVEFTKTPVGSKKRLAEISVIWEPGPGAKEIDFFISSKLNRKQRLEVINMLFESLKELPTIVRRHVTEVHHYLATAQCNELFWARRKIYWRT